jgi:hypothetical protein
LASVALLGISPTTGILGCLRIIFSRRCRLSDRIWPFLRYLLLLPKFLRYKLTLFVQGWHS